MPALTLALVGCAAPLTPAIDAQIHRQELFEPDAPFSRRLGVDAATLCDAARRALMSQGYVIWSREALSMQARKFFRPEQGSSIEIAFSATCLDDEAEPRSASIYIAAWQDHFVVKRSPTPVGVGVSALGSISLPVGASHDALVKIGVETITDPQFYARFYALLAAKLAPHSGRTAAPR